MDILKTYTKNKLRLLMNQPNWINADCEDKSLILQEKYIIAKILERAQSRF